MHDHPELRQSLRVAAIAGLLVAGFAVLSGAPYPGMMMALAGLALLGAARPRRALARARAIRRPAGRASA